MQVGLTDHTRSMGVSSHISLPIALVLKLQLSLYSRMIRLSSLFAQT